MGPLKYREFRLLWLGWVFLVTGSWVHQMTSGWLILKLTDSPFMLGLNGAFMSIPFLITSLYGGAVADRVDRRKLLLVTQGIGMLVAFIPGVLTALDLIQVWHIYALSSVSWTIAAFDSPARHALIPTLVPRSELMRAIALTSVLRRSMGLVGPLIGGIVLTTGGIAGAFFVYAFFNSALFICIVLMRPQKTELEPQTTSTGRAILDGLAAMSSNRILFGILSLEAIHTFFATYHELMPVFARDVLKVGPMGLGFLYAAPGVGAFVGMLIMVAAGNVKKKGVLFFITALTQPVVVALFALSPWLVTSMVMLLIAGVLDVVGGTVRNTMIQLVTEERLRGRVMAMNSMVHRGLSPLSGLQAGTVATFIGAPLAIAAGASLALAYAGSLLRRIPEIRRYSETSVETRLKADPQSG